ncbi:B-cell receptor CD22-like [Channa argus]|uniref:B-cell receptor CD22-like n=1 Tax=Channa argus TaxID=215402 RepID=UPI0035227020
MYPPQLPSVSVSPSAEIVEGSSVTLTCSSDANPAANYTWYKENEDSPKASGQIFTITDFRPEHSGNYSCEAQNTRGRQLNIFHLTAVPANIRLTLLVSLLIPLFVLSLFTSWYCWIQLRKKKKLSSNTEPNGSTEMKESDSGPDYENISAFRSVTAAQTDDTEEQSDSYNVYGNISEVHRCSTE